MRKHAFLFVLLSIFSLTSCDLLNNLNFNGPRRRSSREEESELVDDSIPNQDRSSNKPNSTSKHVHSYGEWDVVVQPTCTEQGYERRTCSCGETQTRSIQELGHDFVSYFVKDPTCFSSGYVLYECTRCHAQESVDIPAYNHDYYEVANRVDDGTPKTLYMECSNCHGAALRWDASEYNTELTTGTVKTETQDGFTGVRFGTVQYSNGTSTNPGTHIVYKIYSPVSCNGLSLSFYIRVHNSARGYAIFDNYEGDTNFGYELIDGQYVKSDKRYGLRVNGEQITLGEDYTAALEPQPGTISWYRWPVSFNIQKGFNIIEIYGLGGYRPIMQAFQIEGFDADLLNGNNEPLAHDHYPSDSWSADDSQHWHGCGQPGCSSEGYRVDLANHTFGNKYDEVAATCLAAGTYKRKCTVCEYVRTYTTSALEHTWYIDTNYQLIQPTKTSTGRCTYRCSACNIAKTETIVYGQTKETALTVDEAIEVGMNLAVKGATDGYYFVSGVVSEIFQTQPDNNIITLWLSSSSQSRGYEFYRVTVANGIDFNGIKVGATILGFGKITRYQENAIEFSGQNCRLEEIIAEAHSHVSDSSWSYDENQHWHQCLAPNCTEINSKIDVGEHIFGEPFDQVISSCSSKGSYQHTCVVCGYTETVLDATLVNHTDVDFLNGYHSYCHDCGVGSYLTNPTGDLIEHNTGGWTQKPTWYDIGVLSGDFTLQLEFNMQGCQGCNNESSSGDCAWRTVLPILYKDGWEIASNQADHVFRMDWFGWDDGTFTISSDNGSMPEGLDFNSLFYAFSNTDIVLTITKRGANVTLDWTWNCLAEGVYRGRTFEYHQSCVLIDESKVGIALTSEYTIFTVYKADLSRI